MFVGRRAAFLSLFLVVPHLASAQGVELPEGSANKVASILIHRCVQCHGKALQNPKGDFGYIQNLPVVAKQYVEPGDLEGSSLWGWLTDPTDRMPPANAKEGPLSPEELALIRWWIEDGAPDPPGTAGDMANAAPPARVRYIGQFHPILVHFPVAFLLLAALVEGLGIMVGQAKVAWTLRLCLITGTLAALLSLLTGLNAENYVSAPPDLIANHEVGAYVCLGLAFLAIVVNEMRRRNLQSNRLVVICRVLIVLLAATTALVGHWGGTLVHGQGYF